MHTVRECRLTMLRQMERPRGKFGDLTGRASVTIAFPKPDIYRDVTIIPLNRFWIDWSPWKERP